jgi:hypothetical protein
MNINPFKVLGLLIFIGILCAGYYIKILDADVGEDKRIKMLKRVFILFIVIGFINIYNVTEDSQLKAFWLVVIATIINAFSVIHSTKKCHTSDGALYPSLFRFQLTIFTVIITIIMSSLLWYSTNNNIFGFLQTSSMENDNISNEVVDEFESVISDDQSDIISDSENVDFSYCPKSTDDDYELVMNEELDLDQRNNCLELEVRREI